jgi:hypothetical protein
LPAKPLRELQCCRHSAYKDDCLLTTPTDEEVVQPVGFGIQDAVRPKATEDLADLLALPVERSEVQRLCPCGCREGFELELNIVLRPEESAERFSRQPLTALRRRDGSIQIGAVPR